MPTEEGGCCFGDGLQGAAGEELYSEDSLSADWDCVNKGRGNHQTGGGPSQRLVVGHNDYVGLIDIRLNDNDVRGTWIRSLVATQGTR